MSGQIQSDADRIQKALEINEWLASCYHSKYPYISRDEFLSQGLIGIARANNKFYNGNWAGYVKVCIQNEMGGIYRKQKRRAKLFKKILKVASQFHYILQDKSHNIRPRDARTGRFVTEKQYRKMQWRHYNDVKCKNGHLGSK